MREQNYTLKILILFLATFAGIFAIWYALMREESADWISSQIVHQASPYAITETEDGLIIGNVIMGYSFDLPKGFKTAGAKNLSFFMEEAGVKKCEIKHYYLNADKVKRTAVANASVVIPLRDSKLIFELVNKSEIASCGKYLTAVKNNLTPN
ncbi:MAG: hypothetical protein PHF50_01525 [Patescibacteria group bacterium]|nr:hypothetical protein [Patescibacteria group bacterium]